MVIGRRPRPRRILSLAAAIGLVGAAAVVGVPAQAATGDDPQWWYGAYGVEQVHGEGLTGEGIKIAVIDEQINPDLPVFEGADLTVFPEAGCADNEVTTTEVNSSSRHGSSVTALLIGNGTGPGAIRGIVPDASVTFYGYGNDPECTENAEAEAAGLSPRGWLFQQALADGADLITTQQGGGLSDSSDNAVYAEAIARQVPLLAAVPNDASTRAIFPAAYVGFVAVNGVDSAQQLFIDGLGLPNNIAETSLVAPGGPFSALGAPDGTWDESNLTQGSSNATPLVAGIVALAMQKYPDATPNQILQSLVHNTGAEDHELQYDPENGYGHGVASLGHVLRVDPSGYDDENPVLDKSIGQPSAEEIAAAEERFASASPQPADPGEPAGNPDDSGDAGIGPFLVTGAIVAGVVVVGAVVLTIVLVRRSHRKDRGEQS